MSSIRHILFIFLLALGAGGVIPAQVDREFWFAVPVVTNEALATAPNTQLTITAHDLPATVTIEMPKEPSFTTVTFKVAAFQTYIYTFSSAQVLTMQNKFLNDGVVPGRNNKGLHIVSDNYINATFESNRSVNTETFTLKGRNALGSDFFTPFQNDMQNMSGTTWVTTGYSAFDVVFTQDNTFLKLVIPAGKSIYTGGIALTGTQTIGPFNRGQTFTGIPVWNNNLEVQPKLANDIYGRSATDHLAGVRLTTTGGQKMAVTIKDDGVKSLVGSNYDLLGEQLVPISLLGMEYFAIRGQLSIGSLASTYYTAPPGPSNVIQEKLYLLATANGTTITIHSINYDNAGRDSIINITLNAGQTYSHSVISEMTSITSSNQKFYCLQVTGFGSELGDEILAPVDQCTGSSQVGLTRMSNQNFQFGIITKTSAIQDFYLNNKKDTLFNGFKEIPGTAYSYLRKSWSQPSVIVPLVASIIKNSRDLFQLFILDGAISSTARMAIPTEFAAAPMEGYIWPNGGVSRNICYGDTLQMVAHGGISYAWLPAEYTSDQFSPIPVVSPPTTTTYVAQVYGGCGLFDTIRYQVNVALPLEARYSIDSSAGCSPLAMKIRDQSLGVKKYSWDFGDGNTFTHFTTETHINDSILNHTFVNSTSLLKPFRIRLIVENSYLCRDTLDRNLSVYPHVTAGFTQSPGLTGCAPFPVTFTNQSVNASKYYWNFGDLGTSSLASPVHTYLNSGSADSIRTVKLVSVSSYYCRDSVTRNFTIHPYVKAVFVAGPDEGCSPHQVSISNTSSSGSTIASFTWKYGDGTVNNNASSSFNYTYTNITSGVQSRNLQLLVTNQQGCTDSLTRIITVFPEVNAHFTQDVNMGCNPLPVKFTKPANIVPVTFSWNFGDGTTSSVSDPTYLFSNITGKDTAYTTRLVVSSPNFCRDTFSTAITVHPFIDASFALNRDDGCVQFDAQITNNSLKYSGITGYQWNFGDGTPNGNSSLPGFSHTYSNATGVMQTYSLRMVVNNNAGCTDTMMLPVKVYPEVIAGFTVDKPAACTPVTVQFTNTSNAPVATSYLWSFGDSASSGSVSPAHLFVNPSGNDTIYKITLTAASDLACRDTETFLLKVYGKVKADFSLPEPEGCSPFSLVPMNRSAGGITQYAWSFGDSPATDSRKDPEHIYINKSSADHNYQVKLLVRNSHLCADSAFRTSTVFPEALSAFNADRMIGCNPLPVKFTNLSNAVAVLSSWDFGDGATSSSINPGHEYLNLGPSDSIHTVRLHTETVHGCTHDTTADITVYAFIDADFKFEDPDVCSNFEVNLSNLSQGGVIQNSWDFNGDGIFETNQDSSVFRHTFINLLSSPAIKNVGLRVKNAHTCYDTIIRQVTVYPMVRAGFDFDSSGCSPHTTGFTNRTMNGNVLLGSAGDYLWIFGDTVVASVEAPVKTYYNYADYDTIRKVKLIASSKYFCKDSVEKTVHVNHRPRARFQVDRVVDCPPFDIQIANTSYTTSSTFYWSFGDGNILQTNDKRSVSNEYLNATQDVLNYTIRMKAVTTAGCEDSSALPVSVFPQVKAEFAYDSVNCSPFVASFVNQSVNAILYSWDFGDGNTSTLENPVNRFLNNGATDQLFKVRLLVRSLYDCWDTVIHNVIATGQPIAEFTPDPTQMEYKPEPVITFTNYSNNQTSWAYQWNFGDGTQSATSDYRFTKTYTHWADNSVNNQFNVTLIATNSLHPQCADTIMHSIRIYPPRPQLTILNSKEAGCEPFDVQFRLEELYAYPDSLKWDFGDGSQSSIREPLHTFIRNGIYNVSLRGVGDGGESYTFIPVTVYPKPETDFDVAPKLVLLPIDKVATVNKSSGDVAWLWDFGDGITSTEHEPQHLYTSVGQYTVSLITYTEHQCSDTLVKEKIISVELPAFVEFPTAFTPNLSGPTGGMYANLSGDNINDIFYPKNQGVDKYHLEIYNRWGDKLFETDDLAQGWDGYYNGKLCKQDVYVYKAMGRFVNGRPFTRAGDVTLLQKK